VPIPGANHLDRTVLTGRPCDYLRDPYGFGNPGQHVWLLPAGGSPAGMRAARRQHLLVCAWKQTRRPGTGALRQAYGISKQTWSRIVLGQRWAGHLGLEALLDAYGQRVGSA